LVEQTQIKVTDIAHFLSIAKDYILFKCIAKPSSGHGVHSPMVYDFTRAVIGNRNNYDQPNEVEWLRNWQIDSSISVGPSDYGAGSRFTNRSEKLGTVIKRSSVSPKHGAFLYRLAKWSNSKNILELGTSVGISAMYLASANPDNMVLTLEGDWQRAELAQNAFDLFNFKNIKLIEGDFEQGLNEALSLLPTLDLVFFDGNHKAEPTLRYFKHCLKYVHENTIFVFDDIRWSREMHKAWDVIAKHQSVSVSVDLFHLGVVFFRKGIFKQHFKINF
jgi:predicted O-methyltransferase YrrM